MRLNAVACILLGLTDFCIPAIIQVWASTSHLADAQSTSSAQECTAIFCSACSLNCEFRQQMPGPYSKTAIYITELLERFASNATVQQYGESTFRIATPDTCTDVRFDQTELDDFEVALERFQNTNYFHTMENRIKFGVLVSIGKEGLIPDLDISSELLREKGEWLKHIRVDVCFDTQFCVILNQGLRLLLQSIERTLASGLKLPEVEAEKQIIENLSGYYKENGHLSSSGAEIESLSFIKAAALSVIMEKEKAKRETQIPRVRKALDGEIYSIVSRIRADPFRDIKLPEAMHDYAAQHGVANPPKTPTYIRESAPDVEQGKLDGLLDRLDTRLRRRRAGAWEALHSDNPDRLSQAANSMVELLDQVIGQVCRGTDLATYLTNKYQTHQKTEWVTATRQWIGKTKDNLHSAKHHVDRQSEQVTKALLTTSESILLVILE